MDHLLRRLPARLTLALALTLPLPALAKVSADEAGKLKTVLTPMRRQGESICYGPGGRALYLTSEKAPTPLWRIPSMASP